MVEQGAPTILADWQFWAASAVALGAALWLLRGVIARRVMGRRSARIRVELTMEGQKPSKQ